MYTNTYIPGESQLYHSLSSLEEQTPGAINHQRASNVETRAKITHAKHHNRLNPMIGSVMNL
jgi:hypothetical protein